VRGFQAPQRTMLTRSSRANASTAAPNCWRLSTLQGPATIYGTPLLIRNYNGEKDILLHHSFIFLGKGSASSNYCTQKKDALTSAPFILNLIDLLPTIRLHREEPTHTNGLRDLS
jgi:hypothetical protein